MACLSGSMRWVKDAGNQNGSSVLAVEDDVPAALHSTKPGTNLVTHPAQSGIIGKHLAPCLQIVEVTDGLVFAPGTKGIGADAEQVGFGTASESKRGHGLDRKS